MQACGIFKFILIKIRTCYSHNFQLAPDVPPQETFVFHWKAITNYFIEATGKESLSVFVYMYIQSHV